MLVGMLTQRGLLRALAQLGSTARVGDVMQRDTPTASIDDEAQSAVERLAATRTASLPVLNGRDLVGVLTAENLSEFLSLRAATGGNGHRPA